jgi:hypothetical protein
MSSLAKCLSQAGNEVSSIEAKMLKKTARDRRAEGYTAAEADMSVVDEVISDLEADLDRILEQTKVAAVPAVAKAVQPAPEPAPVQVEKVATETPKVDPVVVAPTPEPAPVDPPLEKQASPLPKVPAPAAPNPVASVSSPKPQGIKMPAAPGVQLPKGDMTLGSGESMTRNVPAPSKPTNPTLAQDIAVTQRDPNGRQFLANQGVSAPATLPAGVQMPAPQKPAAPAPATPAAMTAAAPKTMARLSGGPTLPAAPRSQAIISGGPLAQPTAPNITAFAAPDGQMQPVKGASVALLKRAALLMSLRGK